MSESFEVSAVIPADPQAVYEAWMNSEQHAAFTGGDAEVDGRVGGRFSIWEGYIEGTTLELEPGRRIVQAWRTTEFPPGCPDSVLEVLLDKNRGGTRVTLRHTRVPDGRGAEYKKGWKERYLAPLRRYFSGRRGA